MKIVGFITEYNPFHNGHQYHLEKAKEITGADYLIAVMSGDYVQRGVPSVLNKYIRTKMALACGVDLVLELPIPYATQSAEHFAMGAVSLLHSLGIVDTLCFGSEWGKIEPFKQIADILLAEPAAYREELKSQLRQGRSFPLARKEALLSYLFRCNPFTEYSLLDESILETFLNSPNNILGIEYCKALKKLNSPITPITLKRIGNGYHDTILDTSFSSATAIRQSLETGTDVSRLNEYMPLKAYDIFINSLGIDGPVTEDDFSLLLKYKLMEENADSIQKYLDVSSDLAARIYNRLNGFTRFSAFAELLKTKELTYTRISRALLHILLQMEASSFPVIPPYARILGFQKKDTCLLHEIKDSITIPLLTKLTDTSGLSGDACTMLQKEIWASNLYESVASMKFNRPFVHELEQQIIIGN